MDSRQCTASMPASLAQQPDSLGLVGASSQAQQPFQERLQRCGAACQGADSVAALKICSHSVLELGSAGRPATQGGTVGDSGTGGREGRLVGSNDSL
jgi:hypothetical protein